MSFPGSCTVQGLPPTSPLTAIEQAPMNDNPYESPQTQGRLKGKSTAPQPDSFIPSPRSYGIARRLIKTHYVVFFVLLPFMILNGVELRREVEGKPALLGESFTVLFQAVLGAISIIQVVAMFGCLAAFFWAASWIVRAKPRSGKVLHEILLFYLLITIPPAGLFWFDRLFKPKPGAAKQEGSQRIPPRTS